MPLAKQTVEEILKQSGYSSTRQRRLVFDALHAKEPMTLRQLVASVGSHMDRASVYRTVALFEKLGVVRRINIGWKYKLELSDKFIDHHHHLTCLNCHKVIAINGAELEELITYLSKKHHFEPTEHQIEIQGYCTDCRKKIRITS